MAWRSKKKNRKIVLSLISVLLLLIVSYYQDEIEILVLKATGNYVSYGLEEVPEYQNKDYVFIDDNEPDFKDTW